MGDSPRAVTASLPPRPYGARQPAGKGRYWAISGRKFGTGVQA